MPSGGTWTVQSKRRPGAYINFIAVPKPIGTLGDRGTMTAALPMTWGPTDSLITLYGEDLINGKSLSKIGVTAFDTQESLPYRVALAGCHKALLYRSDTGGVFATGNIATDTLTAIALYHGTTGNSITVAVVKDKPDVGKHTVQILFKEIMKEEFVVTLLEDFENIESEWVKFVVAESASSTTIPVTTGVKLVGGTNGTSVTDYIKYFDLLDHENWQCMAIETIDTAINPLVINKIKTLRDVRGKKVQAVIQGDVSADYEGIISVKQGFKSPFETVGVGLFPLYVASITAGSAVNKSNTAKVINEFSGQLSIINAIAEDKISDALQQGWFVLSYRQDGAVVVEQDINCLHTFTVDKSYAFSKNRVIRTLDEIGNTTALIFNRNYSGKVDNNDVGRNIYKSELISMIDNLVNIGAATNFAGAEDITVLPGEAVDAVVVDLVVQPVDSMEKLYMTVNVYS